MSYSGKEASNGSTILCVVADDLTGAADVAGLLARGGVPVNLRISVPEGVSSNPAPFEVMALKCRIAPVDVYGPSRYALAKNSRAAAKRKSGARCGHET